jgi:hypothetical protein
LKKITARAHRMRAVKTLSRRKCKYKFYLKALRLHFMLNSLLNFKQFFCNRSAEVTNLYESHLPEVLALP